MQKRWEWIGLMSGSSLDGLDVAFCSFSISGNGKWEGQILDAETVEFPFELSESLRSLPDSSSIRLAETDAAFARFSAGAIHQMVQKVGRNPIAVASHGHTIFHQPANGFTKQIGNGGLLAALSGFPVVSDFRTTDVGLGGQGAPLVPGAERFLFSEYEACLNLGGIANVSFPASIPFLGFDIAPCNQLLNEVAGWLGMPFDNQGILARSGIVIPELLSTLNAVEYYKKEAPKSLGNEDVKSKWLPLLLSFSARPEDVLHTLCRHIAHQVSGSVLPLRQRGIMLVTGGGAYNRFLMACIQSELGKDWKVEIPENQMVSFKEAFCFAFLGLKRWLGEVNCFAEITGASKDSCSGAIYLP